MVAGENVYGMLGRLQSAAVGVHEERCTMVRNRNASCLLCAKGCPSGCIGFEDGVLSITIDRCIGCGTCASLCPTCALEARRPSDGELLGLCERAASCADGEVVIACARLLEDKAGTYDPSRVVAVACLGRVDESLLVGLAERGVRAVTLVQGDCMRCEYAPGLDVACEAAGGANELLALWGSPVRTAVTEALPTVCLPPEGEAQPEPGFYDQVGGLQALGRFSAERAEPDNAPAVTRRLHVMADGTLPHFVPDRRERLLDSLAAIGEPGSDAVVDLRLWGHVEIDPSLCTTCQLCAVFCPTGALRKWVGDNGAIGVEHTPGECVKCHCCQDVCRPGALKVCDGVRAADLLTAAGEVIEMPPVRVSKGGPHSICNSMRDILGMEEVYER